MKGAMRYVIPPLAMLLLAVGCERKVTNEIVQGNTFTGADQCMKCHGDDNAALLQAQGEWVNSVHASGDNVDYTNRGGTGTDCTRCHDQQGFILYVDSGIVRGPYDNVSVIGCFTCHDPHSRGDMTLRTTKPYTLANGVVFDHGKANLCATCHHSRTSAAVDVKDNVSVTNRFGSHHGPQADLIQGTGGWQFAGYTYNTSTHATALTDGCVGCHMGNPLVHNGYDIGGHSFNMVQEETGYNLAAECTTCHAKATTTYDFIADTVKAVYDFDKDGTVEGYQTEFKGMMDSLATLLLARNLIARTVTGTDTTYAPKTNTIADKNIAGALWNFVMLNEDRSKGIHNFKYEKDLIFSSIDYLLTH